MYIYSQHIILCVWFIISSHLPYVPVEKENMYIFYRRGLFTGMDPMVPFAPLIPRPASKKAKAVDVGIPTQTVDVGPGPPHPHHPHLD